MMGGSLRKMVGCEMEVIGYLRSGNGRSQQQGCDRSYSEDIASAEITVLEL